MCRSIHALRRAGTPATGEEIRAAALQFIRKASGFRYPSRANAATFNVAVDEATPASRHLLEAIGAGSRAKVDSAAG